jgi:hypothetical protein
LALGMLMIGFSSVSEGGGARNWTEGDGNNGLTR